MNRAIDTKSGLRDDVEVPDQTSKNFEKKNFKHGKGRHSIFGIPFKIFLNYRQREGEEFQVNGLDQIFKKITEKIFP